MGTLGKYLRDAREALGIDLDEASKQTRIRIVYLKALEEEDFGKLPGDVFVRGFLKNYGKYLLLEESEVMIRFEELKSEKAVPAVPAEKEPAPSLSGHTWIRKSLVEPFIWLAVIVIAFVILIFLALPKHSIQEVQHTATPISSSQSSSQMTPTAVPASKQDKLYLEVVAVEDTWLLVRTDASPQKKAVLKKGESLIWSADDQFLLSFGGAGAIKLMLNGQELIVNEPKNAVVRDMAVSAAGIVGRKIPQEPAKPAPPTSKPNAQRRTQRAVQPVISSPRTPAAKPKEREKPIVQTKPKDLTAPVPEEPKPWEGQ